LRTCPRSGRIWPSAAPRRPIETAAELDTFPNKGKRGLVDDTREITTVWPFVIVYRVTPAEVQILRVWHGAQDRAEN